MRIAALVLLLAACSTKTTFTPLVDAVRVGDAAAVRALAAKGADLNAPSGGNGWSPLLHAVHTNQIDTAAALLELGADVDRGTKGGMTPLMMAAAYDNPEMIKLLLRHQASPKIADEEGKTALDHAITGITDIDRFTYFRCNEASEKLLAPISPAPRKASARWAKMKNCA